MRNQLYYKTRYFLGYVKDSPTYLDDRYHVPEHIMKSRLWFREWWRDQSRITIEQEDQIEAWIQENKIDLAKMEDRVLFKFHWI